MRVTAVESLGNAHDWHAVQDTLRYGLAVFGCNTGLSDAKPKIGGLSESQTHRDLTCRFERQQLAIASINLNH